MCLPQELLCVLITFVLYCPVKNVILPPWPKIVVSFYDSLSLGLK